MGKTTIVLGPGSRGGPGFGSRLLCHLTSCERQLAIAPGVPAEPMGEPVPRGRNLAGSKSGHTRVPLPVSGQNKMFEVYIIISYDFLLKVIF